MENRFSLQVTLLPIVFITLTAGIFSVLNIIEIHQNKKNQIEKVTTEFIDQQMNMAKNRVLAASKLIRFQSTRTEELVRKRVKERVDEAIHIANAFYEKYHTSLSEEDLKEQIILLLSNAVFDHEEGYFFAVDMTTEKIIVHKLEQMVGYSMGQHKDLRGAPVLTEQKKLLLHSDGAFQTIYFSKPTEPEKEFPKQLYVRYFKPFNWLIGTGEYLDDMEKRLQESVLEHLKTLHPEDGENFFIEKIFNLDDETDKAYGKVILSNDPIHQTGKPFLATGKNGEEKYFRKDLLNVLRDPGEGYVSYENFSPKHNNEVKITSFFLYDKTWNWAISSGFYYDVLDIQLAEIEENINKRIARKIWLSVTITLLIIVVMSGIFFVISQRIARTIKKYSTKLEQAQKMEAVGRLAGGVAHDYNNMLCVILGYSDMVLKKLPEDDSAFDDVKEIRRAAERSAEITNQLLAFSRQQVIVPKVLDINETVEQLIKMIKRLIGEDITFVWHPGSDLWPIYMDAAQFNQIIMNLCVNARDAIEGVGSVTVETRNSTLDDRHFEKNTNFAPGAYVVLSISDTGCGMDRQTVGKVFEPFFTTKEQGKGTGLGLSTVYGILEQNGCFIKVYSEPGKGTTFNVYFPKHEAQSERGTGGKEFLQHVHGTETILLLEDERAILNMTTLILQELGYTVLPCSSPDEALKTADEACNTIDLLITDVVMPGMNGREVSEALQKRYPKLRTLFMSGYTANVIAQRGVLWKEVNFIQKPFSKHDLSVKVREVFSYTSSSLPKNCS